MKYNVYMPQKNSIVYAKVGAFGVETRGYLTTIGSQWDYSDEYGLYIRTTDEQKLMFKLRFPDYLMIPVEKKAGSYVDRYGKEI